MCPCACVPKSACNSWSDSSADILLLLIFSRKINTEAWILTTGRPGESGWNGHTHRHTHINVHIYRVADVCKIKCSEVHKIHQIIDSITDNYIHKVLDYLSFRCTQVNVCDYTHTHKYIYTRTVYAVRPKFINVSLF